MAGFRWTDESKNAAEMIAAGTLTHTKIAEEIGVTRQTIHNWLAKPEFTARVQDHIDGFRAKVRSRGIAILENRVDALNDRWRLMQRVISERAESKQMAGVAGGGTGLMVHTVKGVGKGDDFQLIDLYEVDTGLLKELREHEKQAAQELGQWTEKVQSEVRATLVDHRKQLAMLGNERAIELACDLEREISRGGDRDPDPGGVRAAGE
jgi:transposase-like protein